MGMSSTSLITVTSNCKALPVTRLLSRVVTWLLSPIMLVTGARLVSTWRLLSVGGCHRHPGGLLPPSGWSVTSSGELCVFQPLSTELDADICLEDQQYTVHAGGSWEGRAEWACHWISYSNFNFTFQPGQGSSVSTTCLCPLYTISNHRYRPHCNFYMFCMYWCTVTSIWVELSSPSYVKFLFTKILDGCPLLKIKLNSLFVQSHC
jgi:hypothetical protein